MKAKQMMLSTTVGVYLAVTIVQERDDGRTMISLLPLPGSFTMLAWLATWWLAVWTACQRLRLETGWLVEDILTWWNTLTGRLVVALMLAGVLVRSVWWAVAGELRAV